MIRIAPVRLMYNPKVLWFDAKDFESPVDAPVVVLTARGTEYGRLAEAVFEATDEEVAALKTELKPVLRLGTQADAEAAEEAQALSLAAMPAFRELAAEESAEMRPIAVEYLLTCDKAIFYFEAENRIDFRELVRKLANRLHVRVDMRQIGSRDEARMMGGLGHCGQELCCKRLGGEFCPVSIRMAKEQDLSLNPQKISGLCGKLMCCLRYEYEAYKDFHARAPKVGDFVETPDGRAKVVELDVPREILTLLMPDDKKVKFALADMVPPAEEGAKPTQVDPAAWEETMSAVSVGGVFEAAYLTNKFTTDSQLGSAKAVRRGGAKGAAKTAAAGASGTDAGTAAGKAAAEKAKRGKAKKDEGASAGNGKAKAQGQGGAKAAAAPTATTVHRRCRGEGRQVDTGTSAGTIVSAAADAQGAEATPARPTGNRPGQKSSGLQRGRTQAPQASEGTTAGAKAVKAKDGGAKAVKDGAKAKDAAKAPKPKAEGQDKQKAPKAKGQGGAQGADARKAGAKQDGAKQKAPKAKDAKSAAAPQAKADAGAAKDAAASASQPRRQPRRRVRVETAATDSAE